MGSTFHRRRRLLRYASFLTIVVLLAPTLSARATSPVYESCTAGIDMAGFTNSQRLECAVKDMDRADKALNAAYRETMAALAPSRQTALRRDERAWIDQRRARCSLANQAAAPSRDLNRMLCLVSETDDRTRKLRAMR